MPLNEELEALLKLLEPAEADTQRKIFEKYPKLTEGYLRQADYDRNMNTWKTQVNEADEKAKQWKSWADTNVPKHRQLVEDFDTIESERNLLKSKVDELTRSIASGTGASDMDQAQVKAIVEAEVNALRTSGVKVSDEQIKDIAKGVMSDVVKAEMANARTEFMSTTFPQTMEVVYDGMAVNFQHMNEFKKPLDKEDRKALSELMVKRNLSLSEAYEEFVRPERDKKKLDEEVNRRVTDELSKRTMPGVSGVGEAGPLQLKITNSDPLAGKSFELGDGTAAAAAAAELRAEGKF